MKANQKFRDSDNAVSPVIAVILMVAITVVLSATVYVWVSGFGGNQAKAARSITLISNGPLTSGGIKSLSISAADSSLHYADVTFTLNGKALTVDGVCESAPAANTVSLCRGTTTLSSTSLVAAGDTLYFPATAGDVLRILDTQANSVLFTLTIG